jgi:hypothetical protein
MMTRTPLMLMLVAAAALAGCNDGSHTIVAGANAEDNSVNAAANANVTLPPTIAATKIYRCADNDVVYVDWLSDGKSANIRTEQGGSPTQVVAAEPGKPMTAAGGFSLKGTPDAPSVRIAVPGQSEESCKA